MNDTAKLGLLLPAVLNPVTAVVGVGLGLLWLLRDDEDEATDDTVQIKRLPPPVKNGVKPLPTVELNDKAGEPVGNGDAPASNPDADQKQIIRSAMSELGKRSAAARAKKKAERQEQGSHA